MHTKIKNASAILGILICILLISQVNPIFANEENKVLIGSKEIIIFGAASTTSNEHYGTYSLLRVSVYKSYEGGKVFISAIPVPDKSFYASAIIAAHMAASMAGYDFNTLEFYYELPPSTIGISGPSAGAALAIVTLAALLDVNISCDYAITGMILPGGIIGPVGSLKEKIDAAHHLGIKTFLVPYGQSEGVIKVNGQYITLKNYAKSLGMKVLDVFSVWEAFELMTGTTIKKVESTNVSESVLHDLDVYIKTSAYDSMNTTFELLEMAKDYENDIKIPSNIRGIIETYVINATLAFNDAKKQLEKNMYYAAISRLFQSRIYSRTAIYLGKYFISENKQRSLGEIYLEVLNVINNLSDEILVKKNILSVSEMLNLGAAQYRLLEAKYYLEVFNQTMFSPENVENSLYVLAYAYERALTAEWWAKIPEKTEKEIDPYLLARDSLAYAQSLLDLLNSLGANIPQDFGVEMSEWIALKALENQYYPGVFYASTVIISKAALVLYLEYLPAEALSMAITKLNKNIEDEISAIESWMGTSAFLIRSKLEFSKYLLSVNMTEPAVLASLEGIIFSSFLNEEVHFLPEVIENSKEVISVPLNIGEGLRAEIFLIVGLIVGIIVGVSLFTREK